jgi:hypothetical protein
VFAPLRVAREIAQSDKVNALGFCVGGTLLGAALAVLTSKKEEWVSSATFLATMLDFSDTGQIGLFVDEAMVAAREATIGKDGILPGSDLAFVFSSLRANDLVWPYVVNNYLLGETPAAFDILHWNADSTNLPGPMYCYYLRNTYLSNKLREPKALTNCGAPVDLGAIELPLFVLATREDHIVPWRSATGRCICWEERTSSSSSARAATSPAWSIRPRRTAAATGRRNATPQSPRISCKLPLKAGAAGGPPGRDGSNAMAAARAPHLRSPGNVQYRPIEAAPAAM